MSLPLPLFKGEYFLNENFILIIYSGSQDVLDTILGPLEEPKKVEKKKDVVPPPKLKLGSPVMVTKPKEEKKKVEEEKPAPVEVCILFQSYSQYKWLIFSFN